MQYLLTEEEYSTFRKGHLEDLAEKDAIIQRLCTEVANHKPVRWGWDKDIVEDTKPWKCILTEEYEWYCDTCPVQDVCPREYKQYSK